MAIDLKELEKIVRAGLRFMFLPFELFNLIKYKTARYIAAPFILTCVMVWGSIFAIAFSLFMLVILLIHIVEG